MTIQSVPYQTFSGMDYAINDFSGGGHVSTSSYGSNSGYAPIEGAEGVNVDTVRVIDLLLGQLEQLTYQLARSEAQTEPLVAEANSRDAAETRPAVEANADADGQARLDGLIDRYSRLMADVEAAGLIDDPFVPAGPFAGMLFDIAA